MCLSEGMQGQKWHMLYQWMLPVLEAMKEEGSSRRVLGVLSLPAPPSTPPPSSTQR